MSDVRIKTFAEFNPEALDQATNEFLSQPNIQYISHQFMVDGVTRAYNNSIAYVDKGETEGVFRDIIRKSKEGDK